MSQIFEVRVKANSRENKILNKEGNKLKVAVKSPAREGKANKELLEFLSKNFKARAEIIKGKRSSRKIVVIENGKRTRGN